MSAGDEWTVDIIQGLMGEWQRELRSMVGRVGDARKKLRDRLEELAPR